MKSLHPLTWWIWSLLIISAVIGADSGWLAGSAMAAAAFLVRNFAASAPWAKSFNWTLKLSLWILAVRTFIGITIGVPIPGTKNISRVIENIAASQIVLSADELKLLDEIAPIGSVKGERYPEANLAHIDR